MGELFEGWKQQYLCTGDKVTILIFHIFNISLICPSYEDGMAWKIFLHSWPFVKGILRHLLLKGPLMCSIGIFFVVSLAKLLNKQLISSDLRCHGSVAINISNLAAILVHIEISGLKHWGGDKMATFIQMTYSIAFSWIKMYEFWLRFHWGLFLRVQLTMFQH